MLLFVQTLFTYLSSVPVDVLERCLCICFGAYVCANVHVNLQGFFVADVSQCVKCRGLNLSAESNMGERPLESKRHSFLAQKRFKYFLSVCGRKETHGRENNNKRSSAPPFFLPSLSLSVSRPSCLTLSDLIPTLDCSIATESISRGASLEKKISSTVSIFPVCRSAANLVGFYFRE